MSFGVAKFFWFLKHLRTAGSNLVRRFILSMRSPLTRSSWLKAPPTNRTTLPVFGVRLHHLLPELGGDHARHLGFVFCRMTLAPPGSVHFILHQRFIVE